MLTDVYTVTFERGPVYMTGTRYVPHGPDSRSEAIRRTLALAQVDGATEADVTRCDFQRTTEMAG